MRSHWPWGYIHTINMICAVEHRAGGIFFGFVADQTVPENQLGDLTERMLGLELGRLEFRSSLRRFLAV